MPNRLNDESSPYLRQHADNPVDWYPWGTEALARARAEDRPILLSIGYSACHWCHVMEHESFEDEDTAAVMNERFVNIKVDREERPDLDQIYMTAVQGITGHGGWPMTVFLTPDGKPFFGGTYYPPTDRGGMPGFKRVLLSVSEAYRQRRGEAHEQAERVATFIQQQALSSYPTLTLSESILDDALDALVRQFDEQHGGFGGAPKFPPSMVLEFLLRSYHRTGNPAALTMAESTLQHMARGGIYDQIGGGFHRYTVDAHWLVPHFEKMLYDNALLVGAYIQAYQVTGAPLYRRIVEQTLDYVKREMRHESGGFFGAQDADSEGHEGKYYVWTPEQVKAAVASEDEPLVRTYFGITDGGNFEGKSILTAPADASGIAAKHATSPAQIDDAIARARVRMLEMRRQRVPPATDTKILAGWNGLMLRSFADAARVLGRADDRAAAEASGAFLVNELWREGRLFRVHMDGETKVPGYLEDYAAVAGGLLALYEATFDLQWYSAARRIADAMVDLFWDGDAETFFDAARDAEGLVARPRDTWDNATPSGTSLACQVLARLWALTGDARYERLVSRGLQGMAEAARQHPSGLGNLLCALDFYLGPPQEVAIIGDPTSPDTAQLVEPLRRAYLPNAVVALARPDDTVAQQDVPLLRDRTLVDGRPAAYVCRGFVCEIPSTDSAALMEKLAPRR
ncbi:MAG: DUF255 domain-containing protein [Chloroflexi bacterium]|nr:DUF255 domain-containing protein [Chloroflexota bacterium]